MGLLAGVRPHLCDSIHREALRCGRVAHNPVAARGFRRSDLRAQFQGGRPEAAESAGHRQLRQLCCEWCAGACDPGNDCRRQSTRTQHPDCCAGGSDDAGAGTGPAPRPRVALPSAGRCDGRCSRTHRIDRFRTRTAGAFFHVRTAQGATNSGQGTSTWGLHGRPTQARAVRSLVADRRHGIRPVGIRPERLFPPRRRQVTHIGQYRSPGSTGNCRRSHSL